MLLYRSKAGVVSAFIVSVICGILLFLLHDIPGARYFMAVIGAAVGIAWGWAMSIEMGHALRTLRYVNLFAGAMSAVNLGMNLLHPVSSGWSAYAWFYSGPALITAYFLTLGLFGLLAKKS
ncbi:MAG: hypothetical protein ACYDCO_02745 [Armatimonadota bacterium]